MPRLVITLSAVIALTTLSPYVLHWARPIAGRTYTGMERFDADQASYLMWLNQVRRGAARVTNLYAVDCPDRFPPQLVWGALGLVGRVLPVSSATIYHGARVLFGFLYLLVLFRLMHGFCEDDRTAWTAWFLAAVGGGFGWLIRLALGVSGLGGLWLSADYMPEMWSYSSILYFPHFAAALLLLAGSVLLLVRAWEARGRLPAVASGLLLGVLVLVHTYTAVTLAAVLILHAGWWRLCVQRWAPTLSRNALALAVSIPFFAFQAWQVFAHEALRKWAESNVMPSPGLLSYVLGFGFVGLAAMAGCLPRALRWMRRSRAEKADRPRADAPCVRRVFVYAWVVATLILLFSSLNFERRCIEGLHIAIALLAAPVIVGGIRQRARGNRRLVGVCLAVIVTACAPTSIWHLSRELPSTLGYVDSGVFAAEQAAYETFGAEAKLIASAGVSPWIPSRGRVQVYLGHRELTYDFDARRQVVNQFFSPDTAGPERVAIFRSTGCDAVFAYGKDALLLASEGDLWDEVFRQRRVALFVPSRTRGPIGICSLRQSWPCLGAPCERDVARVQP